MCCLLNYTPEERGQLQDGALQALAEKVSGLCRLHASTAELG